MSAGKTKQHPTKKTKFYFGIALLKRLWNILKACVMRVRFHSNLLIFNLQALNQIYVYRRFTLIFYFTNKW